MTQDWTLCERLRALTAFDRDDFVFSTDSPSSVDDGIIVLGATRLSDDGERFYQALYNYGWVRMFDWAAWRSTERGTRLMQDPDAIATANEDDLARVLTTCVRADRFCDGYLSNAFEAGLIGRLLARAEQLLAIAETNLGSSRAGQPAQSVHRKGTASDLHADWHQDPSPKDTR